MRAESRFPFARRTFVMILTMAFALAACGGDNPPSGPNPDPVPQVGLIQVSTVTTGAELDANGYSAAMDGNAGRSIGQNGVITFTDVAVGQHQVALTGLAANCTVAGDNPSTVSVTVGATAQTAFAVTCVATSGSIEIVTVTTGSFLDPNRYGVSVDGAWRTDVGINEAATLTPVTGGAHPVELSDVAGNCAVTGANPTTATVAAGATTTVTFEVACGAPAPGKIAFLSSRGGNPQLEVYVMDGAGEVVTQVTHMAAKKEWAELSPDGTRILFLAGEFGQRDLWVVNVDGTGLFNLTNSPIDEHYGIWSPDGTEVAYDAGANGLWVIDASGGVSRLLVDDYILNLDWSPDGSRIVFVGYGTSGIRGIFVVNRDGTGLLRLTPENIEESGGSPQWSPDGAKILYRDMHVMNADGSGVTQLVSMPQWETGGQWSPDGSMILFRTHPQGYLWVVNADGSGLLELLHGWALRSSWSPDGSTIAFNRGNYDGLEIYTIRPDGSGLSNITNSPSTADWVYSWGP